MEEYKDGMPEQIARDAKRYADMRWTALKLDIVEKLSDIFTGLFGMIVFLLLIGMGLLFFTGVLTYLLGAWLGSMLWAMLIMGATFTIAAVVILALRERLFADFTVSAFIKLFFDKNDLHDETREQ